MVTYARDEIVSASEAARNFSSLLKELSSDEKERIAISKNNKLEAVIVPVEEYERMKEALDMAEHIEIYNIVQKRKNQKTISFEEMMERLGISEDDLQD